MNWGKTEWYYTPTTRHANLTALATLPQTSLFATPTHSDGNTRVTVKNTGSALAFQVRLKLVDAATGDEILPVFWGDNYFELLPGEERAIEVSYPRSAGQGAPRVTAQAWNSARQTP